MLSNHLTTDLSVPGVLPKGTRVRVRNTLGSWAGGFEVESVDQAGYLLRRVSDGAVLPTPIGAAQVKES